MKRTMLLVAGMAMLAGCATGLSPVGVGLITDVKGPITATTNANSSKSGTACAKTIIGLINSGDASIAAAKAAGNITSVASADYHTKGFYPFMGTTCVTVTGN
ncbi:MAG: TRL domain-containing protein [Spongiibacteraceae bacterium]